MENEVSQSEEVAVETGGCKSCGPTSWRPTRRGVIQAAAVAVAAGALLGAENSAEAAAPAEVAAPVVTDPWVCADTQAGCLNDAQEAHDITDGECIANHTGLAQLICRMEANVTHAGAVLACNLAYAECMALCAAEELARAIQEGIDWVNAHPVEAVIGLVLVVIGITLILVACQPPATGVCVVACAQAYAQ